MIAFAGTSATGSLTETWKSYWPSAASRSTSSCLVHTLRAHGQYTASQARRVSGREWVVGVGGAVGGDLLPDLEGSG
jgi:hypothetical protein